MGLLLGDIQHSNNGSVTALIWGALPQPRSDRQKDRVETNPEQLTAASLKLEELQELLAGITHIRILQSFLLMLQSNVLRPVPVSPINKSSIIDLESSLSTDNSLTTSGSTRVEGLEHDTGDSRAAAGASKGGGRSSALKGFFANADTNYSERTVGNYPASNIESSIVDIDPMDMTESMQEAMHRSNLEMSGAEYVRKEVPLHVLPTSSLLNLESPLKSFTDLQSVLYEEEKAAYHQAILQNMRDGKVHPLSFIHHTSTYQASICKLMEYCLSPAIIALQDRIKENEIRLSMLANEAKILEKESTRGIDSSSSSPRNVSSRGGGSPKDLYSPFESNNVRSVSGSSSRSRRGS
ncbi:hypothetical protein E3N88_05539 [Mikania micrantha]|uniref:BRCC36 C-terminal helical domain-containing protein n=1 Tax=Mikania micrantha TaxID=192012 RepID=A0A5N6PL08_9ASTR|nr:hypothetical protein E3N88_05454 [Mikania micrantha]KAD6794643.1 hypothetical protein E3N88_05539 [Mikania micrantha]